MALRIDDVALDIGKQVAAGTSGEFRRISNASGPQASAGQYVSTQDIGKQVAAGTGGEYRRIVTATGIHPLSPSTFCLPSPSSHLSLSFHPSPLPLPPSHELSLI